MLEREYTVKELISRLEEVENKDRLVVVVDSDSGYAKDLFLSNIFYDKTDDSIKGDPVGPEDFPADEDSIKAFLICGG